MHSSALGAADLMALRSFSSAARFSLLKGARYSSMVCGLAGMAWLLRYSPHKTALIFQKAIRLLLIFRCRLALGILSGFLTVLFIFSRAGKTKQSYGNIAGPWSSNVGETKVGRSRRL